jgi:hypothetical protein
MSTSTQPPSTSPQPSPPDPVVPPYASDPPCMILWQSSTVP